MGVNKSNMKFSFHWPIVWLAWVSVEFLLIITVYYMVCMPRSERALINKESLCGLKTTVCPTMEEGNYTKENQTNVPLAPEG